MSPRKTTAAQVRALRERLGLTQVELGELLYASTVAVRKWESGERRCPRLTYEYGCLLERSAEVRRARVRYRAAVDA